MIMHVILSVLQSLVRGNNGHGTRPSSKELIDAQACESSTQDPSKVKSPCLLT